MVATRYILFFLCLLLAQKSGASTSCAGEQRVLGFSKDWAQVYWDEEVTGECSPGNRVHVFDFKHMQHQPVVEFVDGDDLPGRKAYRTLRKKIRKTTVQPAPASGLTCSFSNPRFVYKEHYLSGAEAVHSLYFNPVFQYWIVISNECNVGNFSGTCTYNGFYVLDKAACTLLKDASVK